MLVSRISKQLVRVLSLMTGLAMFAISAQGQEQSREDAEQEAVLEEVVVTARFREENLNDIGSSIAAYSSNDIRERGMEAFSDIALMTPGLNLQDRGPNRNEISVRGVGRLLFPQDLLPISNGIGTYVDDVPVNIQVGTQIDVRLFDMNRVEVLRGPQGTLFGEGAEGGAIRYFTQDPDLTQTQFIAEADVSQVHSGSTDFGVRAVMNLPLADGKAGLRLVANRMAMGGFIDNPSDGTKNTNGHEILNFRAVFLAEPNDEFSARIVASYDKLDQDSFWFVTGDPEDLEYDIPSDENKIEDKNALFSANLSYDFGTVSLQSITSYFERERDRFHSDHAFAGLNSVGASAIVSFATGTPTFVLAPTYASDVTEWDQFSQEFRVVSQFDGSVNFVAGAFYRDFDLEISSANCSDAYLAFGFPGRCSDEIISTLAPTLDPYVPTTNNGEQLSFFVEGTWDINDQWRAIGGVRYHDEDIKLGVGGAGFNLLQGITNNPALEDEVSVDDVLPKLAIEFRPNDDLLLYGSYTTGVRNGNTNFPTTLAQIEEVFGPGSSEPFRTYDSQKTHAYELGFKAAFLEGLMQLNGAVFYNDIEDMQTATFPGGLFAIIDNVGDGHSQGLELELSWQATDNLSLFAAGNILEAKNDDAFVFRDIPGFQVITPAGTDVPYSPDYGFSLGGQHVSPVGGNGWEMVVTGNYQYVGEYTITFEDNSDTLGKYGLLNLALGMQKDQWLFEFRVDNVLNEIEIVSIQELDSDLDPIFASLGIPVPDGFSWNENSINRPRMFRLLARYQF